MLPRRRLRQLVLAAFVGSLSWSTPSVAAAAPAAAERYRLDNGLRVVLAPTQRDADVHVVVRYDAGSLHDPLEYRGLAHLVEHMTFHGSRHVGPGAYFTLMDGVGGTYNATTAREATTYFASVPPGALALALWLESDRMAFALDGFTDEVLEEEHRTVENELEERANSLDSELWRRRTWALYGKDAPGTPDDSEVSNVRATSLADVRWFFQSTHRPDNATLVVAGNFDPNEARVLIARYFATIKNPALPKLEASFAPPALCGQHELRLAHRYLTDGRLSLSWPLAPIRSPQKRAAQDMLVRVLRSRARDALVTYETLAKYVHVSVARYATHGILEIDVELRRDVSPKKVEARLLWVIEELASRPLGKLELLRYRQRKQLEASVGTEYGLAQALSVARGGEGGSDTASPAQVGLRDLQDAARVLGPKRLLTTSVPRQRGGASVVELSKEDPCP